MPLKQTVVGVHEFAMKVHQGCLQVIRILFSEQKLGIKHERKLTVEF